MSRPLILLGASVRAAAYSALRAGFQPYAIDQFADRDLAAVCPAVRIVRYPQDFPAALRNAPAAPWIYTGGLENHPRIVEQLAEIRPLWGNSGDVLRQVRDPEKLAAAVREAGLEMPAMRREITVGEVHRPDDLWLLKPFRSSGGHQVRVALPGFHPHSQRHYYQRLVTGVAGSAVFCASRGQCQWLGASRQLRAPPGDFRYLGSIVDPEWSHGTAKLLPRLGQTLADRFALRGLFNVDFIDSDARLWPLEVNPRYSASIEVLERATGNHFLAAHAAAFDDQRPMPPVGQAPPKRVVAKAIVYAERTASVPPEFDSLAAPWNNDSKRPTIADLPQVGQRIGRGQPLCSVFAEGGHAEEVEQRLTDRIRRLRELFSERRFTT